MRKCLQCDYNQNAYEAAACVACGSALPRVVVIELPAKEKLGVKLKPPKNGVIEHGFGIDNIDNKLLEGKVMAGDLIIAIGGTSVDQMGFSDAVDLIRKMPRPLAIAFEVDEKRRKEVLAEKYRDQTNEELDKELTTYAVVFDEGPMGLNLEEAVRYGIDGAVVKALKGQAKTNGQIRIGDIVYKVNDTEVLCMPYAEVMKLLRTTPSPKTIQFVPKDKLADVWWHTSRHSRPRTRKRISSAPMPKLESESDDNKSIAQLIMDNQNATIKKGRMYKQGRVMRNWKSRYFVLSVSKIEYFKSPSSTMSSGELSFLDHRCSVRSLKGSSEVVCKSPTVVADFLVELRVDDRKLVMACTSETEKKSWMDALKLAIDASKSVGRTASKPEDMHANLDLDQENLLRCLLKLEKQPGIVITTDIPYEEAKAKVEQIAKRMGEIGSADVTHPDPEIQRSLREEYYRLEQDMEKYNTALMLTDEYAAEEARKEREWEEENYEANIKALKAVRRAMPVAVKNMSENDLQTDRTPNGKVMSREIARKYKRTNVLELLRMDPKDIMKTHPSSLENLRVTGLTVTERRALHMHLRDLGESWKGGQNEELTKRKYYWFKSLKETFKQVVNAYNNHVNQYGPADNHPVATRDDPDNGCPLIGKQCPIQADKAPAYDTDFGYPEGDVYVEQTTPRECCTYPRPRCVYPRQYAREDLWIDPSIQPVREHYKNVRLFAEAIDACQSMHSAISRMEDDQKSWFEKRVRQSHAEKLHIDHDVAVEELVQFTDFVNDVRSLLARSSKRAGIESTTGSGHDLGTENAVDSRSSVECELAILFGDAAMDAIAGIAERMEKLQATDEALATSTASLTEALQQLKVRSQRTIDAIGIDGGATVKRVLKTRAEIMDFVKRQAAEQVSHPMARCGGRGRGRGSASAVVAGRGDRGRGGLLNAIRACKGQPSAAISHGFVVVPQQEERCEDQSGEVDAIEASELVEESAALPCVDLLGGEEDEAAYVFVSLLDG